VGDLLLGSPTIQFYLLVLGAGLILALWPDGSGPRGKQAGSRAQPRSDLSGPREGGGQSCPAPGQSPGTGGRGLLAIRELEVTCAAEYAARFGLAIRRIRKA
jgi:hypothetical protein